jgi:hypothetical protein
VDGDTNSTGDLKGMVCGLNAVVVEEAGVSMVTKRKPLIDTGAKQEGDGRGAGADRGQ